MITLQEAKSFLDVIHDADDDKLQLLLDGVKDEALQFMNRTRFGISCPFFDEANQVWVEPIEPEEFMPGGVKLGVLLLLQSAYQASPDDADKLRQAAEAKLWPYRCLVGA